MRRHSVSPTLAFLLALGLGARAAPPRVQRTSLPRLWLTAELPAGWALRPDRSGFNPPAAAGRGAAAVSVFFEAGEEGQEARRLREILEPPQTLLRARGATEFRSGTIERRGPWSLGETSERGRDGRARRALHAVRSAPGGWYLVSAEADADDFARLEPDLTRLLDSLRREVPTLDLAPFSDPGGLFTVQAPTAPWTVSAIPGGGEDFLGAPGPGDEPRALISVQRVELGGRYRGAESYVREETSPAPSRRAGPVSTARTATGLWRRFEVDADLEKGSPERERGRQRLWTAHAALENGKDLYVLTLQAPPASYADYRPVFERVVASFQPRR